MWALLLGIGIGYLMLRRGGTPRLRSAGKGIALLCLVLLVTGALLPSGPAMHGNLVPEEALQPGAQSAEPVAAPNEVELDEPTHEATATPVPAETDAARAVSSPVPAPTTTPEPAEEQAPTESGSDSASEPAPSEADDVTTVYVTRTGEKYHREGCQYLRQSCIPIGLEAAKARGYMPCSKCRPPR